MSDREQCDVTGKQESGESIAGRRRAMKVGILSVTAIAAGTIYQKPAVAAARSDQAALSPGTDTYVWERQLPAFFFPASITAGGGCAASQYKFSGRIDARGTGSTFVIDKFLLVGTLASGDNRGNVQLSNQGDFLGTRDGAGHFATTGTLLYADSRNAAPISMLGATFNGTILGPSDVIANLNGNGNGFCAPGNVSFMFLNMA